MIKKNDVVVCLKEIDFDDVVFLDGETYDIESVDTDGIYIIADDGSSVLFESICEFEACFMELEAYKTKFEHSK